MVCRMLYLCLGPGRSIWPGPCADPRCTAEAGGNSSARAGSRVLTFEKPNSTQQWNVSSARGGRGRLRRRLEERERERKYVVVKKRKNNEGNAPHPVRWGRWVSKLPPPSIPASLSVRRPEQLRVVSARLWLKSTVRENLFPIWAFPVNAGNGPPHKAKLVRSHHGATALLSLPFCSVACSTTQLFFK